MRLIDATESAAGKYHVLMHASQGVQVGDHNSFARPQAVSRRVRSAGTITPG
jgi:RIP homotypic interaction motif (RHIM)-containing protein